MTTIDIQVNAAHCDWLELRDISLAAEQLGFGALWVFDHLAGVALAGDRMLECFTLLGALAATTSTIELGVLVANVWNRQVGTLVSAAASVAVLSGRQFHLGIGAGTSPRSKWAVEQHAVAAELADTIEARHARVEQVLDLTDREWAADREPAFATFPLPSPAPTRIIGVNSVRLSEIAGRRADGINIAWNNPRRDEFLDAANIAAAGRPFLRTVWMQYDEALLDTGHPVRLECEVARIDRLVLLVTGRPASWR